MRRRKARRSEERKKDRKKDSRAKSKDIKIQQYIKPPKYQTTKPKLTSTTITTASISQHLPASQRSSPEPRAPSQTPPRDMHEAAIFHLSKRSMRLRMQRRTEQKIRGQNTVALHLDVGDSAASKSVESGPRAISENPRELNVSSLFVFFFLLRVPAIRGLRFDSSLGFTTPASAEIGSSAV